MELDLLNSFKVDGLPGVPQVMIVLHRQPTLGRAPESPGTTKRHFGTDSAAPSWDAIQGGRRNAQLGRQPTPRHCVWLEIHRTDGPPIGILPPEAVPSKAWYIHVVDGNSGMQCSRQHPQAHRMGWLNACHRACCMAP